MAKYRLTGTFFDGIQLHKEGAVIEHDGKPSRVMVLIEEAPKVEAPPTLEDLTVHQLREIAKGNGVQGAVSQMNKAELIAAISSLESSGSAPPES